MIWTYFNILLASITLLNCWVFHVKIEIITRIVNTCLRTKIWVKCIKKGIRIFSFCISIYIYLQDAEQWEDRSCVGKTRIYANQLHIYISENFLLVIDEFCILILHKQTFTADILCFEILFLAIIRNIMFWNSFNKNMYS